ncbi:hypothetical protein [Pseudomonas sp. KNUC1026]|uniref:hypothetical protein n=1 Tax=Pseudomonas sp. KNUC1026 TaxID=2893890 RepID=UPI001F3CC4DC|nr:hypothetical protein [Pseudomonas sp. KNUC1026]UFH51284.1 hypothetical protein LN139_09830 [Pseudomonas sp. KNUC1026]
MSAAPEAAMIAVNMHGEDPMLDIPWPQIQGNQAVFIERITLAQADLEILGSQIERELYLFGGTVFTGEVHPRYGRLQQVHYLVIEKQLHNGALIYHPLSQNEGVMFSRKGEDTERACVDMLKKKDILFLRRPPKWKASEASIPACNGQLFHFCSQVYLPETATNRNYLTFVTTVFLFVHVLERDELRVQVFAQDTSEQTAEDHYRLESQMMRFEQEYNDTAVVLQLVKAGNKLLHEYLLNHPNAGKHTLELLAEYGKTKALKAEAAKRAVANLQ